MPPGNSKINTDAKVIEVVFSNTNLTSHGGVEPHTPCVKIKIVKWPIFYIWRVDISGGFIILEV